MVVLKGSFRSVESLRKYLSKGKSVFTNILAMPLEYKLEKDYLIFDEVHSYMSESMISNETVETLFLKKPHKILELK
jgi:hypothetical protein